MDTEAEEVPDSAVQCHVLTGQSTFGLLLTSACSSVHRDDSGESVCAVAFMDGLLQSTSRLVSATYHSNGALALLVILVLTVAIVRFENLKKRRALNSHPSNCPCF